MLVLTGEVTDQNIQSVLLKRPYEDFRHDSILEIPVVDGRFSYRVKLEYPEFVELFLGRAKNRNGGRFMELFLENENIELTIYTEEDFDKNVISGGVLNAEFLKFKKDMDDTFMPLFTNHQKRVDSMKQQKVFYTAARMKLEDEEKNAKTKEDFNRISKEISKLIKEGKEKTVVGKKEYENGLRILSDYNNYKLAYINKSTSIVAYSFLINKLQYFQEDLSIERARKLYDILSKANPGHPYNKKVANQINAIDKVQIGKPYIDFTAPDLQGNPTTLSDEINGKTAILNLWATWCAPCIKKTRAILPIYDEFKDKNLTMIGVAGEFKNTNRLNRFLEKEKWGFKQLIELDRKNEIWQKYNLDLGGGAIFLIDADGKILAKDPTANELKKLLKRMN